MTLDHLTPKIHVADTVSLTRKAELGTTTHAWDWRLYVGRVQGSKLNSNSILTSSCLPKKCLGRHCSSPDAYHICKHACSKMLAYNTIPTRTAAQPSGGTSVLTVTGIYTMAEGLSTLRCSPRCPRFRRLCQNCRSCTSQFCREGPAYGGVAVASRRSIGAQKGPSSIGQFSPANGAIGILHVALTPSWSQGLPRPPYQLDMERVKAISPVGQSQIPSTHALGIGIRSKTGTHHSTCNIGVPAGMLFVNKFTNRLCEDGDVRSPKHPNPGSCGRDTSLGMQRSGHPCSPHSPSANFHVIIRRQRNLSGKPTGYSIPEVGLVCMSHTLIIHAPRRSSSTLGSWQAELQYAMVATFERSRVMRTSPVIGDM